MNQVKQMIRCGAEYDLGVTGRGVGVAVLDTRVFLHKDFEDRAVVFRDMLQRRDEPYDSNGHGTHISAIIGGAGIASKGRYCGMASGCNFTSIRILDEKGNGHTPGALARIRWVWENKDRYGVRIVNISVGSYSRRDVNENSTLIKRISAAWNDDLAMVMATGNQGSGRVTITTPGVNRGVIMVGCSDDRKEVNVVGNRMVDYSGRGPAGTCIYRPDVVAPGSSIINCASAPRQYMIKSGTSASMLLVFGAIALPLEKYPDMSNRDMKLRLRERCVDSGLPRNQQG